jgi:taurine dioxygenase
MSITVTPMSDACGAEISGINLREPLDAATVKEIEHAFHEHVVVVFRGQDITEDEQMAFANAFGGLGDRRRSPNGNTPGGSYDTPFMFVTNIIDEKTGEPIGAFGDGEMWFHHDTSYYEKPHKATLLYSITLPSAGGNTCFANMYKAYDHVPADLKAKLEGRKILQIHDYKRRERIDIYNYASIHMRRDFPRDEPRLMRRLTLGGYGALN